MRIWTDGRSELFLGFYVTIKALVSQGDYAVLNRGGWPEDSVSGTISALVA